MLDELNRIIWAKTSPYKSLYDHLHETAVIAKTIVTNEPFKNVFKDIPVWLGISDEDAVNLMAYLAGVHDIGKCAPGFVEKADTVNIAEYFRNHSDEHIPNVENYRHEKGGACILKRIWKRDSTFDDDVIIDYFSHVISLHHQGRSGSDAVGKNHKWEMLQDKLEASAWVQFTPPYLSYDQINHADAAMTLLTALIILSDWIASSDMFADSSVYKNDQDIENACLHFIDETKLASVPIPECEHFDEMFPAFTRELQRPLQKELDDYLSSQSVMPEACILEAPMGEGKTEAGFYAAGRMAEYFGKTGMYVALPTSATSNQMYGRLNSLLNSFGIDDSRLIHGSSWLNTDFFRNSGTEELQGWLMPSKRAMLSPFGVGTVDQAMLAVLKVKYGVLRLLGLADKVLIIDEIHAYDAYMSEIITKLLRWCRELHIPVVMLSATLPRNRKKELLSVYGKIDDVEISYPLITAAYSDRIDQIPVSGSRGSQTVRLRLSHDGDKPEKIAAAAAEKLRDGGCLCIIANTVKKAQDIYQAVKRNSTVPSMLFHSRFTAARRDEIEKECIRLFGPDKSGRPERFILVATQVVEQSLDLDFDYMISEIAPVDLVLQRCGRLHRHSQTVRPESLSQPEITVLLPAGGDYGATELVYYKYILNKSKEVLSSKKQIDLPVDIRPLVEAVYSEQPDEKSLQEYYRYVFSDEMKKTAAIAAEFRNPMNDSFGLRPDDYYADDNDCSVAVKTRTGAESGRLAIIPSGLFDDVKPYLSQGKSPGIDIARKIFAYSISVPQKNIDVLTELCNGINKEMLTGASKIYGMLIMSADSEDVSPTDTTQLCFNGKSVTADKDLGFIIQ